MSGQDKDYPEETEEQRLQKDQEARERMAEYVKKVEELQ